MAHVSGLTPDSVPGLFVACAVESLDSFERQVLVAIDGQTSVRTIARRFGARAAAAEGVLQRWFAADVLALRVRPQLTARLTLAGRWGLRSACVDTTLWRAWGEPEQVRLRRFGSASSTWRLRPRAQLGPQLLLPRWWLWWRGWSTAGLLVARPLGER